MERLWLKHYDKGVPHSIYYPPLSLKDLFDHHSKIRANSTYLISNDAKFTYGICNSISRKLAHALVHLDVKKGDRIALLFPNVPQYAWSFHAAMKIGAIITPMNPLAAERELINILTDSGAETLITLDMFAKKPISIFKTRQTPLKRIIIFQQPNLQLVDVEKDENIYFFNDLNKIQGINSENDPDIQVLPEDIALLQYTGGTTGVSKGCMLRHKNLVAMAYQENYWFSKLMPPAEQIKTLAAIPLYHIFGFNTNINFNLVAGGSIVLVPQPTIENILDAINNNEPSFFAAVPTMIIGLNQHPKISESKIGAIKAVISGSAPLPVEALKRFEAISGAKITEGYGLSETSNVLTCSPSLGGLKPGSVGLPLPDNMLRIVDCETGKKEMPVGEAGEIIARGPTIMEKYWNQDEETALVMRDGWLFTGDIGKFDDEGSLYIIDRKKDIVLVSGFNVYPREIDELLYSHPKIAQACCFGIKDETRGEAVAVSIVLKPGENLTSEEVTCFCKEHLSSYKVPKHIYFVNELPLTPVGKPDRKALKHMYANLK
ncbi:MAG: long-chain fatty acid--CoA ligase [Oligoflexales bacterium]|nr:long-chain fatty acid--CoA ligase [Oligoflexales bacterium]